MYINIYVKLAVSGKNTLGKALEMESPKQKKTLNKPGMNITISLNICVNIYLYTLNKPGMNITISLNICVNIYLYTMCILIYM